MECPVTIGGQEGETMDFNSEDFRDQLEAIVFKIRTGFVQVIKLLVYGLLCGTLVGAVASVFALGIDGAGYDFYDAHWVPLYRLRGFTWHKETA